MARSSFEELQGAEWEFFFSGLVSVLFTAKLVGHSYLQDQLVNIIILEDKASWTSRFACLICGGTPAFQRTSPVIHSGVLLMAKL